MWPAILAALASWIPRRALLRLIPIGILMGDGPFATTYVQAAVTWHRYQNKKDRQEMSLHLHDPLYQYQIPDSQGVMTFHD